MVDVQLGVQGAIYLFIKKNNKFYLFLLRLRKTKGGKKKPPSGSAISTTLYLIWTIL